jgi:chaperonin GroEL (HSP60 family)
LVCYYAFGHTHGQRTTRNRSIRRRIGDNPQALAENAVFEPIDVLAELTSAHEKEDGKYKGVNVFTGEVENNLENGIIELLVVKEQAITSAVESASMILRIDEVISATKPKEGPGGKMPGGTEGESEE